MTRRRIIEAQGNMSEILKNFIGGHWIKSAGGKTFDSLNPATHELIARCTLSEARDVEAAVGAAAHAFDSWRRTPAPRRAEILFSAAEKMKIRKKELARLVTMEMGKVLPEGRGDVQGAIDMTCYMAGEGRRLSGQTVPAELPDKFAMSVRDPIGVVACITPWNFPIAVPCWKIMPALVLGNTVVLKPSSDTPLCAVRLIEILKESGIPNGVVNLVLGSGGAAGEALVSHPKVAVISFTGSNDVGHSLGVKAAQSGKRCHLEMGGKNAILVMEDADLNLALEGIVWSAFGTSGQRCTAASRIIVHKAVRRQLTEMLVDRVKRLRLGDGLEPTTDVGPVINQAALEKIHRYVQIGQEEGARLLTGGEAYTKGDCARGFFYRPTVFDNVRPEMRIAQEEIFGPVTALMEVSSLEEAITINNEVRQGLSSSIYTRDINRAFAAMRDITTGIVNVNAGTSGVEVQLPFGGTRATGNGHREAGQAALDTFSEWKTIYVDYSGKLQKAQIDPALERD